MDRGEAFHRAICERPEDDTVRLIYADYLDEQEDDLPRAWAEFIRVQVELKRIETPVFRKLTGEDPSTIPDPLVQHHAALRKREDRLFDTVRNIAIRLRAGRPVFQFPRMPAWDRGFPDTLTESVSVWMTHGPELVTHVPLTTLWLGNLRPDPEPDRGSPTQFGFHCADRTRFNSLGMPGRIRRDWFDLLPPDLHQYPDPSLGRWYATQDAANRAVGFAALNWARKQAGMPLLGWPGARRMHEKNDPETAETV